MPHPLLCLKRATLIGTTVLVACGSPSSPSDKNPVSSPPPGPTPAPCRKYATSYTYELVVPDAAGQVALRTTGTFSAAFDATTTTLTTNGTLTSPDGVSSCSQTLSSVATYQSVSDFVDEGRALGRTLVRTVRNTTSSVGGPACGPTTTSGTITYNYDAQGRLISDGNVTYTAWDSSGRPTTGTAPPVSGATCSPLTVNISYNDAARSMTVINEFTSCVLGRQVATSVLTYDSDAIQLTSRTTVAGSNAATTQTLTTLATAQVCK